MLSECIIHLNSVQVHSTLFSSAAHLSLCPRCLQRGAASSLRQTPWKEGRRTGNTSEPLKPHHTITQFVPYPVSRKYVLIVKSDDLNLDLDHHHRFAFAGICALALLQAGGHTRVECGGKHPPITITPHTKLTRGRASVQV